MVYSADSITLMLNLNGTNTLISDFIVGAGIEFKPIGDNATVAYGANGSAVAQIRADANVYAMTLRLIRNSNSDKALNNYLNATQQMISGTFKAIYNENGEQKQETYTLSGGVIKTRPNRNFNNADVEASVEYVLQFETTTNI